MNWLAQNVSLAPANGYNSATDDALLLTINQKHNRHRGRSIYETRTQLPDTVRMPTQCVFVQSDTVDVEGGPIGERS